MKISLAICPIWNLEQPPLSISYVSGQLKAKGHDVCCYDFSIDLILSLPSDEKTAITQKYLVEGWYGNFDYWRDKLSLDLYIDRWSNEILKRQPELVGFSIYDSTQSVSLLMASTIKAKAPGTIIVFGGPSCDNTELILRGDIDFLVVGEGENTITELVERLESNKPVDDCPGLVFLKEGQAVETGKRPSIPDINKIPFPDFKDFDMDRYPAKALPMFTSRGCPNRCSFCSESPRWGKFRYRNADNITREMERNVKEFGITHFSMEDSTINGNISEFVKMCDILISQELGVTWGGKARIDPAMTKDVIKKAYLAGCRGFIFGIESASQRVLDHMKKNVNIPDVEEVVINSYEAGIDVGCFFIIGYVNETEEDFEETLKFIRRNYKYIRTIYPGSGLHILKGSKLYKQAEQFRIILPEFSPDSEWCITDGTNTGRIRTDRLKRFNELVSELYNKKENHP